MSDVAAKTLSFFTLYEHGQVSGEAIDEFIEAWHDSPDTEQRSLAEFLGMIDMEYAVSGMAPGALPLILRARRENIPLRSLLVPYLAALRANPTRENAPVIHALGYWLDDPAST